MPYHHGFKLAHAVTTGISKTLGKVFWAEQAPRINWISHERFIPVLLCQSSACSIRTYRRMKV
jgi:hypothetical protein